MDWFGSKKKSSGSRSSQGGGSFSARGGNTQHHHHNTTRNTERVRIVEKKVYVNKKGGLPIGKAIGAVGGGMFSIAKKGYDMSQQQKHDPMSRSSAYGSKAKYKDRADNMEKVQLGFPNNATMKRMRKTGFSFLLMVLAISFISMPLAYAAAPVACDYEEGDGELEMLNCFIFFVYSVSIGMVIAHPLAILYVFIGVITILVFLAFAAIVGGAVSKAIER